MTAKQMWERFTEESGRKDTKYEAWQFGDDADRLAELTAKGIKTATCSAYCLYEAEGETMPQEGEYSVILNAKEEAVCVIQTTKVFVEKFQNISEEHAYKEGEGDRSLAYWRKVHKDFFANELAAANMAFSEDMLLVCEEFAVVYPA